MPISSIRFLGEVSSRSEARALVQEPGDVALVVRGRPRWLVMACPCGCGQELAANLDDRVGPAWRVYKRRGELSVYPSVWLDTGCMSHFVLLRNRIYLFGSSTEWQDTDVSDDLGSRVLGIMKDGITRHFDEIAELVNEIPWDIYELCGRLTRQGLLVQVDGLKSGKYKISEKPSLGRN